MLTTGASQRQRRALFSLNSLLCMESGTFPIPATQVDSTLVMTTANTFT